MKYEATYESVHSHPLPKWYDDAKFGIFIHWGLYSVPAFAGEQKVMPTLATAENGADVIRNSPYAEWYLNSMKLEGAPTREFHQNHYGDKSYFDFQKDFEEQNAGLDLHTWTDLIQKAGAKYLVLVTKHHDGYTLWPSEHPNPKREGYGSKRDFVGELQQCAKEAGLRMGVYYSGVYDWTFKEEPIDTGMGYFNHREMSQEYITYSVSQFQELIDRYHPDLLWNDIGFPGGYNINELFAYYYNRVTEGVINDRWSQMKVPHTPEEVEDFRRRMMAGEDVINPMDGVHYDFTTPEYKEFDTVQTEKWETNRGIGRSYGFNRMEAGEDYLTGKQVIDMLIRIVARNGNLLLNIGPRADGTIPYEMVKPLLEVGQWLEVNGDAIYGTRPYRISETTDGDGTPVYFTAKEDAVYAISIQEELGDHLVLKGFRTPEGKTVELLGTGEVSYHTVGEDTLIRIPADYKKQKAYAFRFK